jgi:hypothetical protein
MYGGYKHPEAATAPDPRLGLDPQYAHLFREAEQDAAELLADKLASSEPITASWVHVVRSSVPGAGDGIIEQLRDPVPHPMLENRKGRFVVTSDDIITPADDD